MAELHPASDGMVYLNGSIIPAARAHLPIDDSGVLFGFGFFETFRTCGGRPHLWNFHRQRLVRACATAGIELPDSFLARDEAKLRAIVTELLKSQGAADAVFRYTITAGAASATGVRARPVEFLVPRALPPELPEEGVCLRVLNATRDNGEWLPRPKSLSCANTVLGGTELQQRRKSFSDEGLFLSREGAFIVETTRQNIAWILDGELCYPEPALGAIAGTCLEWVLDLGVPREPRRAPVDELLKADAIVVMNSVRGVTAVNLVYGTDDRPHRVGLDSAGHPMVVSLRRQWIESMEATAED